MPAALHRRRRVRRDGTGDRGLAPLDHARRSDVDCTAAITASPGGAGWEANDWFPVMFASIVNSAIWVGFNRDGFAALLPAAAGVTAYGAAYALVHDVYIHRPARPTAI